MRARRSKTSREMQSEANEDREDAETSCVQRSMSPLLIHALAGCGRRCAVLILGGIGPSSTQHRVGVASFRSEQQYLYGIATIFRFRAQVMSQLWCGVLRFSCLAPPLILSRRRVRQICDNIVHRKCFANSHFGTTVLHSGLILHFIQP